jgi:hypothetical protein
MNDLKPTRKVIPFKGEMWEEVPPTPHQKPSNSSFLAAYIALSLIAGLSMGAISTYNSVDQVELRNLKANPVNSKK